MKARGPAIDLAAVSWLCPRGLAVDSATARFVPGEIHAVVGENGAGKSSLLKLMAGVIEPSSGSVSVGGGLLRPASPAEAARRKVFMVHQHFMLVGAFTALENMLLGNEPVGAAGVLDVSRARREIAALAERTGLTLPLDTLTDALGVGEKQRLEILRVLHRGAEALLLDEPTAVLTPLEANDLYATLRGLADEGRTVVVVTHRLDEVVRFADRVTVMRRGRVVLSKVLDRADESSSVEEVARAIMGHEPPPAFAPPKVASDAAVALAIEGLAYTDAAGRTWLDGVDLAVKRGEIVGIAGVEGNGQRELVQAIAGLLPRASGSVSVAGRRLPFDPNEARAVRSRRDVLRVVHEDRHSEGLMLDATVADNLVLGALLDVPRDQERATVTRRIAQFGIVPPDPERRAAELSGGNQQKIVVARALDGFAERAGKAGGAVVLAQPTRGVDVGAAAAIHAAIGRMASAGLGVLVVSADLAELRLLCHRLLVVHKGHIVAGLDPSTREELIGRAMLGLEAA